jgi:hypothetical protein
VAALEGVLTAARMAGSPLEAWESAAVLLREHHGVLNAAQQVCTDISLQQLVSVAVAAVTHAQTVWQC